ncbi:hypothetical protein PA18A_1673 [Pseudomonas aeruginosa 18A]|nr:hypothetical protein PA18A_1673 [Pseudomonas aeruginosa 18A]
MALCAFLAGLALFVAAIAIAAIAAAILLAAVATLVLAGLALGSRLAGFSRLGGRLILACEQADQGLHQALEQARLGHRLGRLDRCFGVLRCGLLGSDGLDCCFLADQGAGRADRLGFFVLDGGHFVAGLAGNQFGAVIAQTLDFEMRGFQMIVRQDEDARAGTQFDLGDGVALLVEQEGGDLEGHAGADFRGAVLQGFFLNQAQDGQRQRLDVADDALAVAARADDAAGLAEGRTQALAGHFQQAEARDATDLDARAVGLEGFADTLFHGALVLRRGHVDEVDDDQAADVTQAQLAGDFLGRFQVGLQGGFLDVAALGGARRVDVDGNQGLGRVDDDGAAGRQLHFALESGLDLALDLEAIEQRNAVLVQLHLAGVLRHHLADEVQGFFLGVDAVDQHFADVLAQVVADGADDDVAFLVDQEGRATFAGRFLDRAPQLQQVVEVPLQFLGAAAEAGGAHDQAHVGRCVEAVQGLAQLVALFAFDTAGDATGARVVRHQHQVTAGQADEGGQGGALVAALFLLDLDDDFLAFAQDFLDVDPAFGGLLEVFAGDFFEGEEAVAFGAEVDEGGFEAGFDASDAAFVDVGLLLLAGARLDVEVEQALAVDQCNTQLLGLSRVDQHSFHVVPMVSGATGNGDRHTRLSRSVLGRVFRNGGPFPCPAALGTGCRSATTSPASCVSEALESGGGIGCRRRTKNASGSS